MNNAPAPESEQAGSGRAMRFVGTCRIAGRHFPSVVCTVSTIYLGLVFAWTSICVALANAEPAPAPALAPAPTPVAVAAATPGGDEPATIDMQVLAKLRELESDMPGLLSDVITTYLRETPGRIDRIIAAVGNGDAKIAERGAHGLKGSSSAMGALKMAKLCEEIERRSEAGNIEACSPLAAALIEEFYLVNKSLAHELGALTANTNS